MTGTSDVDNLLAKAQWRDERKRLRALILDCGLEEAVKWGKLCYGVEGSNVAIIYGMKSCCAVGFFKGSLLADDDGVLVQPGKHSQAMRQLRFDSLDEINRQADRITAFVEKAIQAEKDGLEVAFDEKDDLEYPVELHEALDGDDDLAAAFADLTPGRQRGYVLHVSDAKAPRTRRRRIAKSRAKILAGKGLNER